jgi:hypothetical protein
VLTQQHHEDGGEEEGLARGLPMQSAVWRQSIVVLLMRVFWVGAHGEAADE